MCFNTTILYEHEGKSDDDMLEWQQLVVMVAVSMFDGMIQSTPKQEVKAKEFHTLPVVKIILDWLLSETDLLTHAVFKKHSS